MDLYKFVLVAVAMLFATLVGACSGDDAPEVSMVPDGMVEVRPVLAGSYCEIPRVASDAGRAVSRTYDPNSTTEGKLGRLVRLPEGSTVWLIASTTKDGVEKLVKNSYIVYNPEDDVNMSYLVPCNVNDKGEMTDMEGTPLYLKEGLTYKFSAVSPARKLNEADFEAGRISFQVKNGEAFYANDCRYTATTPGEVKIDANNPEAVQEVTLSPMINQTARLRFEICKRNGVHEIGMQPSGVQVSGLQNDSPTAGIYGDPNGIFWHMSQALDDEPIILQHGSKTGVYNNYTYKFNDDGNIEIDVPVLPMRSISKPVIVLFRLRVNGVPVSFEMMINEKDFKAGYSYGYRGYIDSEPDVTVVSWQYITWETSIIFPFN